MTYTEGQLPSRKMAWLVECYDDMTAKTARYIASEYFNKILMNEPDDSDNSYLPGIQINVYVKRSNVNVPVVHMVLTVKVEQKWPDIEPFKPFRF